MQYEVYKVKSDTFEREYLLDGITAFNWQDDIKDIFTSFDFTAKNKNDRINKLFSDTSNLNIDDWIELYCPYNEKSVLYGKIDKIEESDKNFIIYSGFDYGKICETIKTTIQFNQNETISKAIISTLDKTKIKTGYIETISPQIKKIFKNEVVSKIFQSVYEIGIKAGTKDEYYFDCKDGKVNLLKYKENNNLKGYIANIYSINSFEHVISFKITQKNKKENEISMTVYGDCNIQKGVITNINLDDIGIDGAYLVNYSEHSIVGAKETVTTKLKSFVENV